MHRAGASLRTVTTPAVGAPEPALEALGAVGAGRGYLTVTVSVDVFP